MKLFPAAWRISTETGTTSLEEDDDSVNEVLDRFYKTVSGSPRAYVDNSKYVYAESNSRITKL